MARSLLSLYSIPLAISLALMTILAQARADPVTDLLAPESDLAPDDSDSDIIYSPEPSPNPTLLNCASKITLDCASEILANDFFRVHVEAKCCKQLTRMGKQCNDMLVDDILTEFDLKKRATKVHNRSDHLWSKCLQVLSKY